MRKVLTILTIMGGLLASSMLGLFTIMPAQAAGGEGGPPQNPIFIPMVTRPGSSQKPGTTIQRINAPHFDGGISFTETAIFWFGKVEQSANYVDVRLGYNNQDLYVYLSIFDRSLWYDITPNRTEFQVWDSASIYLDLDGSGRPSIDGKSFRFDSMFQHESLNNDPAGRAVYQGNGGSWRSSLAPFSSETGWRGVFPNDNQDDKGWSATFHIPFSSLGLSGPPLPGTLWNLGVSVYDRDDAQGNPVPTQLWPSGMESTRPSTWGQLLFGLPTFLPPTVSSPVTQTTIRHGLNGVNVSDSAVGGGSTCGGDPTRYWTEWGEKNFAGTPDYNIQNQSDVSDWPCFSKIYLTFPLDSIPAGKNLVSASLRMSLMGNSEASLAKPSLVQVSRVAGDWQEQNLTWNNAPQALENVSQAWVNPITVSIDDWTKKPVYHWDLSRAAAEAYAEGNPLRLVLYTADSDYHSGKYFVSSDTGDWNANNRPTLTITWGTP